MKVLIVLLFMLLTAVVVVFAIYNTATVPITVWYTSFPAVELWVVVVVSIIVGVVFALTIGLVEGTATRIENRRLRRTLRKLETENNYLRTQPSSARHRTESPLPAPLAPMTAPAIVEPASAPVYGSGDEDEDDDVYSGGSAV
ncbi:MAG: lipopolysaccharide assembly protein LapA domain-containing protein [Acidobacteriota bacterium]|nr:lipopolysaccharide assembly protein LapA domain-containing protein [Acidobacteriota bacterium]MDH3786518.1 lipopolysaccharide assembly protein LapA domain-containing protein [Acidobacteriota bacterium]